MPKYPDVHVELSGQDGNALYIIARVNRALRRSGVSDEEVEEFNDEAISGDYDHLLRTCAEWVTVS